MAFDLFSITSVNLRFPHDSLDYIKSYKKSIATMKI